MIYFIYKNDLNDYLSVYGLNCCEIITNWRRIIAYRSLIWSSFITQIKIHEHGGENYMAIISRGMYFRDAFTAWTRWTLFACRRGAYILRLSYGTNGP